MTRRPLAAVFAVPEVSHVLGLLPVIAGLHRLGWDCVVHADRRDAAAIEAAGGRFVDLFAGRPLDAADDRSTPMPVRYVTWAGRFGAEVATEVAARRPDLVVHDTFAVIGLVVGHVLGLPTVNASGGHDLRPAELAARLAVDPRVALADEAHRAVDALDALGLADPSPFLYATGTSQHLNLYPEPPQFLPDEGRRALEPLAFFGALADLPPDAPRRAPRTDRRRLYASFGTVVWRYFADAALDALVRVVDAVDADARIDATISLGGHPLARADRDRLAHPRVRVEDHVDQRSLLAATDVFVTHHGLRSTHEALHVRTPMVSIPFFWDQGPLAARCQALGLAVPASDDLGAALRTIEEDEVELGQRLEEAQRWELETLAGRPAVIERIAALAGR